MKSQAAQAAAQIRQHIKKNYPGLKFTCTSENYAGGSSVNVRFEDQPKDVYEAIKEVAKKHQYGHFDGMHDIYEYSNSRDDLPQAKFVFVENKMSAAKKQEVYTHLRNYYAGGDKLPENYGDACNSHFQGQWMSQLVWQHFNQEQG